MEDAGLQELYRRYSREVFLYLYAMCRNWDLAEDLMQETFLQAMLSLADDHVNMRAWLYRVARNLCLNRLKRDGRQVIQEPEKLAATRTEAEPLERLLASELNRTLYEALAELPAQKREVLLLQYVGRLSQREIAAVLKVTPEHVRVLAFRARKELKARMEDLGYDLS